MTSLSKRSVFPRWFWTSNGSPFLAHRSFMKEKVDLPICVAVLRKVQGLKTMARHDSTLFISCFTRKLILAGCRSCHGPAFARPTTIKRGTWVTHCFQRTKTRWCRSLSCRIPHRPIQSWTQEAVCERFLIPARKLHSNYREPGTT